MGESMKILLLSFLIFCSSYCYSADQVQQWRSMIVLGATNDDVQSKYMLFDFSKLLMPKQRFLGFLGTEHRKLDIVFLSVTKSKIQPNTYFVKGTSTVGDHTNDFTGSIVVEEIREFQKMHYGVDKEYEDKGIRAQGVFIGAFKFIENPVQKHSGIFRGTMSLHWYLDKNGKLRYDDIEAYSDNYSNNQYVGTWIKHRGEIEKISNWGEYRIPFSGDLDIGAGEFSPNPKYFKQGWGKK